MMDSLLLYKILKNRTGAEISASGNPVTLSGTLADNPLKECKIYGWSKQETTTGAQLFNVSKFDEIEQYGVKLSVKDGVIYAEGTPTQNAWITAKLTADEIKKVFKNGKLTIKSEKVNNCNFAVGLYFEFIPTAFSSDGSSIELTLPENINDGSIYYYVNLIKDTEMIGGCKIMLYQDGNGTWEPYTGGQPSPSPEYPQEIISAGSDGKINLEVHGKNLFDFSKLISDGVNVMDYEKQTITVPAKTNNTGYNQTLRDLCPGITPGTYVFSMKRSNPESGNGSYFLEAMKDFPINTPIELTDELLDNHISWYNSDTSEVENVISEIQIEKGNTVTSYEPYHESQSLSIQTPTGLPAIPVGTGGNYTDADGQQWIADYIDLKRGKYVQNVTAFELTGDEKFRYGTNSNTQNILGGLYTVTFSINNIINKMVISNAFVRATNNWTHQIEYVKEKKVSVFTLTNAQAVVFVLDATTFPTKEDFVLFLKTKKDAGNPVVLYYNLSEPIEQNLTQSEIQAYQNLVTYAGTTIVKNDADCYMEVSAGGGDALRAKKLALLLED